MSKFNLFFIATVLLIGFFYETNYGSDIRLQSLANCRLALIDQDNELNLYDWVDNPAYLLFDDKSNWLRFYSGGNYNHTSLVRTYDPRKEQNLFINFEGLKQLKSNQAVLGGIRYNFNRKYQLAYALERTPYNDDPLILADTTTGSIFEDGPTVFITYNYQPLKKISIGIESEYQISTSLKKEYTRPRTIHRNFESKIALVYKISPRFFVGTFLSGSYLQDQIELQDSWDGKAIYVLEYRSELVYREKFGNFDRYIFLNGMDYNLSLQYQTKNQKSQHLLTFHYLRNKQTIEDKTNTVQRSDSYWFQYGFVLQYDYRFVWKKFVFSLESGMTNADDWSEHPFLPILITERSCNNLRLGTGISRRLSKLLLVAEAGFSRTKEDYKDYQSEIYRAGIHDLYSGKFGIEYYLDPIHVIRAGFSHDYFFPDYYSPRYLSEHASNYFSLGMARVQSQFEIDFHLDYSIQNTPDNKFRGEGWNIVFYSQIFMN
jgi:hypothetical protein